MKTLSEFQNFGKGAHLKEYLGAKDLKEDLKITEELSFHWANWDITCLAQRKHYKNFNNNYQLMKLNQSLQDLKSQTIWLCNKVKTVKTDLYSLYESYLDSRLRMTWFERKEEILFSAESEHGPYFTLTSMRWLDKDIYAQFVMRKILLEHYTLRSFRLNASIPILFKLDNDVRVFEKKVAIHQISEAGFIFKITDKNFLNKIKNSQTMDLIIPTENYKKILPLNTEEGLKVLLNNKPTTGPEGHDLYRMESRIMNSYGNLNNARRSSEEEFYLFARFQDLKPIDHENELKSIFLPLVEKIKAQFMKQLEEIEALKKEKQFIKKVA